MTSNDNAKKQDGSPESEPITRDSWHQTYTYRCMNGLCKDDCDALRAKGCVEVSKECAERIGGVCTAYHKTYRCSSKKKQPQTYTAKGDKAPFCLTGHCEEATYEENGEMLDALTQLSILQKVQEDIKDQVAANISIFKGQIRECTKHAVGFSDCCTTGQKGWGQSLHLKGCSGEEKELAEWRGRNLCVLVGTYSPKEKVVNIRLRKKKEERRKKTVFCCFGTKLSRLIQEQGRAQLNKGFGTPRYPDCGGLTPEELGKLDFSKMDLSELYQDIQANFKPPEGGHMAKGVELERIKENMKHLTSKVSLPDKERKEA